MNDTCTLAYESPTEVEIKEILTSTKTIAIVGLSANEEKASNKVAKYLTEQGYRIFAVNPGCSEILGAKCFPDLKSIPEHIDVVDVFRNPDAIPGIVDEAIAVGASTVWMQLDLRHEEAASKARCAGLRVVMDKCMKIEHDRIFHGVIND